MSEILDNLTKDAGDVLSKTYDDLAHPTVASVGTTLSLLPRTINVLLGKWQK